MPELGKAHVTTEHFRIPISRKRCAPKSFRNVTYSKRKGIKALICCPAGEWREGRCQDGMLTRTVLYDKEKWTKRSAEAHAKKRFMR